jgi:hypothetical protein
MLIAGAMLASVPAIANADCASRIAAQDKALNASGKFGTEADVSNYSTLMDPNYASLDALEKLYHDYSEYQDGANQIEQTTIGLVRDGCLNADLIGRAAVARSAEKVMAIITLTKLLIDHRKAGDTQYMITPDMAAATK